MGSYTDATGTHGFLLDGGVYTRLDFPTATGTTPTGINDAGQITGYYSDGVHSHGFIRIGSAYRGFDAPGAVHTFGRGINREQ